MAFIVTPAELSRRSELYHQLGAMLSAGVPLVGALEMASVNPAVSGSRSTVLGLIAHLNTGLTFSESMLKEKGWMPDFDIALLSVGESSGRLDAIFKLLANYYSNRATIIRNTISGMIITVATLHVFLLVFPLNLLILCAQGIMNGEYDLCVPFVLEKLVVFGGAYCVVLLFIYACQGRHGEPWRFFIESFTRFVPILRTAQKYLVLSRLAGALEAAITSGQSILKGWELAGAASGSPRLRREISDWKPLLEGGATPGELVSGSAYFPEMFANLYFTGEHSGKIDETLARLQVYYQEEGFRRMRVFTGITNGVIYGAVALMIGIYVINFYKNYFSSIVNPGF
jgi:type II secretory pathway component PulF